VFLCSLLLRKIRRLKKGIRNNEQKEEEEEEYYVAPIDGEKVKVCCPSEAVRYR
jgi:hypothetical protein